MRLQRKLPNGRTYQHHMGGGGCRWIWSIGSAEWERETGVLWEKHGSDISSSTNVIFSDLLLNHISTVEIQHITENFCVIHHLSSKRKSGSVFQLNIRVLCTKCIKWTHRKNILLCPSVPQVFLSETDTPISYWGGVHQTLSGEFNFGTHLQITSPTLQDIKIQFY
jgi:hypothetical protein